MELNNKERNFLRKKALELDAVVRIGKGGLTDSVLESIKLAIDKQELIKVKLLNNTDEEVSRELSSKIEAYTKAVAVYIIGHTLIFFKKKVDEKNNKGPITKEFYDFRNGLKK